MPNRLGFYVAKGGFIPYTDEADKKFIEKKIEENDFEEIEKRMDFTHFEFDHWGESD